MARYDLSETEWRLIEPLGAPLHQRLWNATGLRGKDINLPQLYDGFSPFVYIWMEVLGLCGRGEAHQLVLGGRDRQ